MVLITEKSLRALLSNQKLSNPFILSKSDKLTPSAKDFLSDRKIQVLIVGEKKEGGHISYHKIPVGVSNRHVHLSQEDIAILFGKDATLSEERPLSQTGQFAAREKVTIVGPNGAIKNVRVLGPARELTQVEISRTDGYMLGTHPPLRLSGNITGTPGITLVGPKGSITLREGLIVAQNHVHMSPADAKKLDVIDGDSLILRSGKRGIYFTDVIARVKDSYKLDFHIDQDEANASGLSTGDSVFMVGKNQQLFSLHIGDEKHE